LTKLVLEAIAHARPRKLLVVADGPRLDRPGEREACAAARAVIDRVNWDCEVIKHYSDVHLGCGPRLSTGLSWVFDRVEEAIILEDDCVPQVSFFRFCEELLGRYRDDERVMHIAGSTYRARPVATAYSYFFSQFNGCWGWATWRRAWSLFDPSVKLWQQLRHTSWLTSLVEHERAVHHWASDFEAAYHREGDLTGVGYWDRLWTFACWANSGLSIVPRVNLVANVGCGVDGTHMLTKEDPTANLPVSEIAFPLVHPPNVLQSREADRQFLEEVVLPRLWKPSRSRMLAAYVAPAFVKQAYHKLAAAVVHVSRGTTGA
jgi:hypothetical protein